MNEMLPAGRILSLDDGSCKVIQLLGTGQQGEVYRVQRTDDRREFALKWYYPQNATAHQKKLLENLKTSGPPDQDRIQSADDSVFLWPLSIATDGAGGLGYLMKLRPEGFFSINALMDREIEPTFRTLCRAAYHLAEYYDILHSRGYAYRDISFGNVFLNPKTGAVLIADNDNVSPNSSARSAVAGTPRFMAPEIVIGKAKPSRETDLYSLAVLLFYMLFLGHPLDGANEAKIHCLDLPAMNRLYGTNPIFVYDPKNAENRPVPGYHDNVITYWKDVYPAFLRDLFTTSFTDGLTRPNARITEKQWMHAFAWLSADIYNCPRCGAEMFYRDESRRSCWCCGKRSVPPLRLQLKDGPIVVSPGNVLLSHHVNHDYSAAVLGMIAANPANPAMIGLKNTSSREWTYIRADGTEVRIPIGRSAALNAHTAIRFSSNTIGKIVD